MNKKGFTLVELIATITVLGLLALLASTSVIKELKDSKGHLYKTQIKLIESAAKTWAAENINKLPDDGECKYLTIKYLQDYGLIDKDITNPKTGKKIDTDIKIKISSSKTGYGNDVISYEINPRSVKDCSYALPCALISGEAYTIGAKYSCDFGGEMRSFYILELGTERVTNSTLQEDEVALILDGNYDSTIQPFCDQSGLNPTNGELCNADGLTAKLDEIASVWTKLERNQITLPSATQVVVADGMSGDEYINEPTLTNKALYKWTDNTDYGKAAPYAYWTTTLISNTNRRFAYGIDFMGRVRLYDVTNVNDFGLRPVVNIKRIEL